LLITAVLLFTCTVTPFRVAFVSNEKDDNLRASFHIKDTLNWTITNYAVDFAFLIDIFINFASAYQDDDYKIIDDLKLIAENYMTGWFLIDIISIFPFEFVLSQGSDSADLNGMAKITRIGRMYKLVKLTKLLRILKILKAKSKIFKYA